VDESRYVSRNTHTYVDIPDEWLQMMLICRVCLDNSPNSSFPSSLCLWLLIRCQRTALRALNFPPREPDAITSIEICDLLFCSIQCNNPNMTLNTRMLLKGWWIYFKVLKPMRRKCIRLQFSDQYSFCVTSTYRLVYYTILFLHSHFFYVSWFYQTFWFWSLGWCIQVLLHEEFTCWSLLQVRAWVVFRAYISFFLVNVSACYSLAAICSLLDRQWC
jgi:hypothetical protein